MIIYQLTTNERTIYVRSTPAALCVAMFIYIKRKRAEGVPLANIIYAWTPIVIHSTLAISL